MVLSNPENISNLIIKGCDEAQRTIRETLAAAPGFLRFAVDHNPLTFLLADYIKESIVRVYLSMLKQAADLFSDAIDMFRDIAKSLGRPTDLRNAADALNSDVITPTESLEDLMTPSALLGTKQEHWKSKATDPYSDGFTLQADSAGDIAEIARALEGTLRDMASSIESFYAELVWAYGGFALAVVGLAMVPTTGPGAIVGIILAAVGVLTAIISLIVVFTNKAGANADTAEALASAPSLDWNRTAFAV